MRATGLTDEHRLTDHRSIDHRLERLGGLIEPEAVRDARRELPLARQCGQRLHVRSRERRVRFVQPADAYADGIDALDQEVVAFDAGRAAAEEAEDQQPTAPCEAA